LKARVGKSERGLELSICLLRKAYSLIKFIGLVLEVRHLGLL
jgi:hypothetical protein